MTTEEKKKNESILRVAYLIAAADGNVNKEEREVFKTTLQAIQGFEFGEPDTTSLIEKVIADADSLVRLRDFYDENQIITALVAKTVDDICMLLNDKIALRRAFAVWISMCVADKTFSDYERKIIKTLQTSCNSAMRMGLTRGVVCGGLLTSLFSARSVQEPISNRDSSEDSIVTDAYLAEVESRCFLIDQIKDQYDACSDEEEKVCLQQSIEGLIEAFKEFINDTNN